ncbi:MAG: internalin related protein [Bacillales bacterium]|jgi:hypothetical protein|nr:internalin related protein [Bacillales bacterium]
MKSLKRLDFAPRFYTTEEITQILASSPYLIGKSLKPYLQFEYNELLDKDILICGKGKPFLNSKTDASKIEKYFKKFDLLIKKYSC